MSASKTEVKKQAVAEKDSLSKEFLNAQEEGKIVKLYERKKIEILQDMNYLKKGQIIEPFIGKANFYIEKGLAKEVK